MVSTDKDSSSAQSTIFTHYQQKPSQHVFVDQHYFSDMQINSWLYLSSSLWGISLRCDLFRRRIEQKNVLPVKFFFLFRITQYSGKIRQKKEKQAETKRYALQANTRRIRRRTQAIAIRSAFRVNANAKHKKSRKRKT